MSKNLAPRAAIGWTLLVVLALACNVLTPSGPTPPPALAITASATPASATSALSATPPPSATRVLSPTPLPSATGAHSSTPPPSATRAVSPTPAVPVYNAATLGDTRLLDSYILTTRSKNNGSGIVNERLTTLNYLRQPFSLHKIEQADGLTFEEYWIGDWIYQRKPDYWSIHPAGPQRESPLLQSDTDVRQAAIFSIFQSGTFTGPEDFHGTPANHFTFASADLNLTQLPPAWAGVKAQGELYLAQAGNYPLYTKMTLTGDVVSVPGKADYAAGVYEIITQLAAVNQPLTITLPANVPAVDPNLDLPLPPDTSLDSVNIYPPAAGGILYFYKTTVTAATFAQFYQSLAPTNGWTVAQAGEVVLKGSATIHHNSALLVKAGAQAFLNWDDAFGVVMITMHFV